ncbi:MAG: hypothetical protein M3Z46_01515 [Actinomycetota bacterium]|nr:hypothetical protein [Actinomycetota bacterium]
MEPARSRVIWQGLEHLNAVTYFAPECRAATDSLGLRGFWAGYFANRAAPMGAVSTGVVEAMFFNFHPSRVRKAIPEVWDTASPPQLVASRRTAAAAALRRMLAPVDHLGRELVPSLTRCIDAADGAGRVLFSANREVPATGDPVEDLWQAATAMREHRGDGHVSVLTAEGLDGCEVHVLFAATAGVPAELMQTSRGWSPDDWKAATRRLVDRRLMQPQGAPTERGAALRAGIEVRTDELAARPYQVLSDEEVDQLIKMTAHAAQAIAATALIPYPNPMGLPAPQ